MAVSDLEDRLFYWDNSQLSSPFSNSQNMWNEWADEFIKNDPTVRPGVLKTCLSALERMDMRKHEVEMESHGRMQTDKRYDLSFSGFAHHGCNQGDDKL